MSQKQRVALWPLVLAFTCATITITTIARAHEEHEHHEPHPVEKNTVTVPSPSLSTLSPAASSLVLESTQFEVVGTLEKNTQLSLYLDNYASNTPIPNAQIEIEIAGQRMTAIATTDGSYQATLPQPLPDGKYPITISLLTGESRDILTGAWIIQNATAPAAINPPHDHAHFFAPNNCLLGLAGFSMIAILLVLAWRRDRQCRG